FPEGTAVEKMMAHQMKQPTPIQDFDPEVSDDLVAVVSQLMAKTPEGRFPSTADVVEALKPIAEGRPAAPRAAPPARGSVARVAQVEENGESEEEAVAPPSKRPPAARPTPPPPPKKAQPVEDEEEESVVPMPKRPAAARPPAPPPARKPEPEPSED